MARKILIVEDSKTYMALASSTLQQAGFDVYRSENIWISRLVSQHHPDLVLMDVSVGGCNGTSAVTAMRKCSFGRQVKIMLHSSEPQEVLSRMSNECGADGFIVKDGHCANLVNEVKRMLGQH
ncbi:MAG TPA: response regulator [Pseudomonadales bacterium]